MPSPLSVVFLGSSEFAVPSLRALKGDPTFDVRLVITQPDKPVGRKKTLAAPPVKDTATALGLPVLQPASLNEEFDAIRASVERPDMLVVVSYGQILSDAVLAWPVLAPLNVHASLLPELRGASPLQHAILLGKSETGVTVQRMAQKLDAGPILGMSVVRLDPRETFVTLHDRLAVLGANLLTTTLKAPLKPVEQRHEDATFCGKLKREDGRANPETMDAEKIDRMIRALSPWPGVTVGELKLLQSSLEKTDDAYPLPCAGGTTLFLTMVQPAGGKPMSGGAYFRRARPSKTV